MSTELIGVLIGGIIGLGSSYFIEKRKENRKLEQIKIIIKKHFSLYNEFIFDMPDLSQAYTWLIIYSDKFEKEFESIRPNVINADNIKTYDENRKSVMKNYSLQYLEESKIQELADSLNRMKSELERKCPKYIFTRYFTNIINAIDEDRFIVSNWEASLLGDDFLKIFIEFKFHWRSVISSFETLLSLDKITIDSLRDIYAYSFLRCVRKFRIITDLTLKY